MTMWSPGWDQHRPRSAPGFWGRGSWKGAGDMGQLRAGPPGASGTLTLWSSVAGQRFVRSLPGLEEFQSTISVAAQTPLHFP